MSSARAGERSSSGRDALYIGVDEDVATNALPLREKVAFGVTVYSKSGKRL